MFESGFIFSDKELVAFSLFLLSVVFMQKNQVVPLPNDVENPNVTDLKDGKLVFRIETACFASMGCISFCSCLLRFFTLLCFPCCVVCVLIFSFVDLHLVCVCARKCECECSAWRVVQLKAMNCQGPCFSDTRTLSGSFKSCAWFSPFCSLCFSLFLDVC